MFIFVFSDCQFIYVTSFLNIHPPRFVYDTGIIFLLLFCFFVFFSFLVVFFTFLLLFPFLILVFLNFLFVSFFLFFKKDFFLTLFLKCYVQLGFVFC